MWVGQFQSQWCPPSPRKWGFCNIQSILSLIVGKEKEKRKRKEKKKKKRRRTHNLQTFPLAHKSSRCQINSRNYGYYDYVHNHFFSKKKIFKGKKPCLLCHKDSLWCSTRGCLDPWAHSRTQSTPPDQQDGFGHCSIRFLLLILL